MDRLTLEGMEVREVVVEVEDIVRGGGDGGGEVGLPRDEEL